MDELGRCYAPNPLRLRIRLVGIRQRQHVESLAPASILLRMSYLPCFTRMELLGAPTGQRSLTRLSGDTWIRMLGVCPIPEVIRNTRAWAHEVSAGRREVAASAYAYLLKQYKYADNDPRLIGALLEAVHNYFSAT